MSSSAQHHPADKLSPAEEAEQILAYWENLRLEQEAREAKQAPVPAPTPGSASLPITVELLRAGAGKPAWIEFRSLSDMINYQPPRDFMLMGDCHLTRGNITILSGWPGVGKSRAALALAIAGARGVDWLGHKVHHRFRSMILQCENGPMRLKKELSEAAARDDLDDWLRITPPPPYGMAFDQAGFREELTRSIAEFKPGLLVIDPWNRVAAGDKQGDYRQAPEDIESCLPPGQEDRPAILIVHHMRKKCNGDAARKQGRDLLHELAGSYQIGSAARCVFALEPASNDTTDDGVILTCCKNNDGKLGAPSAWRRRNGLFDAMAGFDMEAFLTGPSEKRPGIPYETIAKALRGMHCRSRTQVAQRLIDAGICERTKAFEILKEYVELEHIVEDRDHIFRWLDDPKALG